jgi:hypothetical protein
MEPADRFVAAAVTILLAAVVMTAGPAGTRAAGGRIIETHTEIPAVDSVTVGERIRIVHRFDFPDSLRMLRPEEIETGTCRILSLDWRENRSDGAIEVLADISVITLDLEEAFLPGFAVDFVSPSGDTLVAFADEVTFPVRGLTAGATEPRPLKGQWVAPRDYTRWLVAGGLLLLAAALLIWWLRRRAGRETLEPPKPKLPADYIALTELTRIEKMNLLEDGQYKKYYTLVTDVVRRYLEGRFGVDAMDRTTAELLFELERRRLAVNGLDDLLNEADLVKFARLVPGPGAGEAAISTAREIIVKTKPAPVESAGGTVAAAGHGENRAAGGGGGG